jgi:hypothetical protein
VSSVPNESLIRAAFSPARSLEPTEAEIAEVLNRVAEGAGRPAPTTGGARRRLVRRRALGLAAAATFVVLGAGYAATPPLRAAIDDLAGTFSDWIGGDSSKAPGRPLGPNEQAPSYFHDPQSVTDPRVIAEADGYKLYAAREPGEDTMQFDLGDTGVGFGGISADSFRDQALVVLGPGSVQNADENGHVPLFGLSARNVTTVELTYASGPPLRVDGVEGGFVLLAEPERAPREIIARATDGRELGRALVDDSDHEGARIDWTQYGPPAPRAPSRCLPGAVGTDPPPSCPGG